MSSSTEKKQQSMTMTRGDVKKAVKAAPNIVYADHIRPTVFQSIGGMDAAAILIVPDSGYPEQLTVHRPIGVTDCVDGDWVISRTADVPSLLARAKDPRQGAVEALRAKNRLAYLLSKGLLEEVGGKAHYPGDGAMSRVERLEQAEKKLKEATKAGKARAGAKRMEFLEEYFNAEAAIVTELGTKEARAAEMLGAEQTYRTMGGVLEDQPQVPCPGLKNKNKRDLGPFLTKAIFQMVGRGVGMNVSVVQTVAPEPRGEPVVAHAGDDPRVSVLQAELKERGEDERIIAAEVGKALDELTGLIDQLKAGIAADKLEKLKTAMKVAVTKLSDQAHCMSELGRDSGL